MTAQAGAVRDAELVREPRERVLLRPGAEDVQAPVRVLVRDPRPGHQQPVEALAPAEPAGGHDDLGVERGAQRPGRRRRVGDALDPRSRAQQRRVLAGGLLGERADEIEPRVVGGDRRPQAGLVAAEVHVVLPDAHDRGPRVARDREVQAGARADEHAVAHRADEAEQVDVGARVEARIADVLGMDQPARALRRPALPRPRRAHVVGQRAQAHARVELERRPLAPAVRAHDLDLVLGRRARPRSGTSPGSCLPPSRRPRSGTG